MTAHQAKFVTRYCAPLFFLIVTLAIKGCVSYPQSRAILQSPPDNLAPKASLNNVPFVAQEEYFCGPSAMSMMLQAQDIAPPLASLIGMIYVPERQGSFQVELIATARRFNLIPYRLAPQITSVLQEINSGNPVLVLQNLGLPSSPTWHYAVAVGYDLTEKTVTLHSGLEQSKEIAIGTFERTWANYSESWALVMLPSDRIPATATPLSFQSTIEDLISIGKNTLALRAYTSALLKWPDAAHLHIGLGNLHYQLANFSLAAASFENAISTNPKQAFAWNNLAYSLANQGCEDAINAAKCATKLRPQTRAFSSTMSDVRALLKAHVSEGHTAKHASCLKLPTCPESKHADQPTKK